MTHPPKTPAIWLLSGDIMSQLGGGFRQQRWCEYLLARGQSIRLFHVAGALGIRWVDVHSVDELRDRRKAWIVAAPPRAGVRDSRAARVGRVLKHVFMLDLFFPSIVRLIATMNAMLRDAPPHHVALLCSSPPFAMGVAGRMMKAMHGDRIVMALDMRDLWSLHTAFPGPKVQKRLVERWVIGGADIFTTVAPALAARFTQRFGRTPDVVFNVATHVRPVTSDPAAFDWTSVAPLIRVDTRKIVYTGSIPAGFYDLSGFLDAVERFTTMPESRMVQMVFVGAGGELVARLRARSIPDDLIVFAPQVSHTTVAEIQNAADVLLFLGYQAADNQGQVSIKLFEYFRREKAILPIHIRTGSDVDWLIRHYGGFCPNLVDIESVVAALAGIARDGSIGLPCASDVATKEETLLRRLRHGIRADRGQSDRSPGMIRYLLDPTRAGLLFAAALAISLVIVPRGGRTDFIVGRHEG